jgi:hypothetical protein
MNDKLSYFLMFLGMTLILLIGIFCMYYYFNSVTQECVSNPLVYGAKQLEDRTGKEVIGTIVFVGTESSMSFNSKEWIIKNPKRNIDFNDEIFVVNNP